MTPRTTSPAPPPFPHEVSSLPPDPAVVWGRLENGLRYAILPHSTPRQRASVVLLVQAGAFHERADELGFAHFVEHMAFRDLRGFPGQTATAALDRLGASQHANAETGLFETRYYFHHVPVTDSAEPDPLALSIMRAVADGVAFKRDAVESERGVIFSEQRFRATELTQARPDELEFIAPHERPPRWPELSTLFANTRLAQRHPIGDEATLRAASAESLRSFYDRWYRPEKMILVVAGDVAAERVERRIREKFSSLAGRGPAPEELDVVVPANHGAAELVHRDTEPAMLVTLGVVRPLPHLDDTGRRLRALARRLALAMFGRRLERAAETGKAPFFATEAFSSHYVPQAELVLVRANARPNEWEKAITAIDLEVRRVNMMGFSAAEFDAVAKSESLRRAAAARQIEHQSSAELATALAVATARGVVFTSAEHDRKQTELQLTELDPERCHAAFKEMLWDGQWALSVIGRFPKEDTEHKITYSDGNSPLTPYEPPAPPRPFPFTEFGPPGTVVKHDRAPAVDIELIEFANGVRLNLKRTRFEPGQVRIGVRLHGGRLANPPDKPGLAGRTFLWVFGGLEGFQPDDLNAMLRDMLPHVSYNVTATGLDMTARVQDEHLPLVFQAGTAFFLRPAFREEAAGRTLDFFRQATAPHTTTPHGIGLVETWHRMSGRHPAFGMDNLTAVTQRTADELKAWLRPLLASAPLEIAVLGDFDPSVAIDACARTFGALPARKDAARNYAEERRVQFPPPSFSDDVGSGGSSGSGVALSWPAPEAAEFPVQFHAHILASILNTRVFEKLRVEMGETYGPSVRLATDPGLIPAVAFLHCFVEAAPERLSQVAAATREVAAALHRHGATAQELERARQPLVRETEMGLRSNAWWFDVVACAQSNPGYGGGWARALPEYERVPLEAINALARQALAPERLCQVLVRPSG